MTASRVERLCVHADFDFSNSPVLQIRVRDLAAQSPELWVCLPQVRGDGAPQGATSVSDAAIIGGCEAPDSHDATPCSAPPTPLARPEACFHGARCQHALARRPPPAASLRRLVAQGSFGLGCGVRSSPACAGLDRTGALSRRLLHAPPLADYGRPLVSGGGR